MPTTRKTKPTQMIRETEQKPQAVPLTTSLTPHQEEIADLVGDLLLKGGNRDDFEALIWTALEHKWRRMFADAKFSDADEKAEGYARGRFQEYDKALTRSLRDPLEPGQEADPKTVTEYIRAESRDNLRRLCWTFLDQAIPEEIHFLAAVLMDWESNTTTSVDQPEFVIGDAFELNLGRGDRWVKVPHEHRDRVVDFVELLTRRNGKVA